MMMNNENDGRLLVIDILLVLLGTLGVTLLGYIVTTGISTGELVLGVFFAGIIVLAISVGDLVKIAHEWLIAVVFVASAGILNLLLNIILGFGFSNLILAGAVLLDAVFVGGWHFLWNRNNLSDHTRTSDELRYSVEEDTEEADLKKLFDEKGLDEQVDLFRESQSTSGTSLENLTPGLAIDAQDGLKRAENSTEVDSIQPERSDVMDAFFEFESDNEDRFMQDAVVTKNDRQDLSGDFWFDEVEEYSGMTSSGKNDLEEESGDEAIVDEDILDDESDITSDALFEISGEPFRDRYSSTEELAELEERLSALMTEVGTSGRDTDNLYIAVENFKKELSDINVASVEDDELLKTGVIVRDKLQQIIDRQVMIDEILDDLMRLSHQISERIEKLTVLEKNLAKRQEVIENYEMVMGHESYDDDVDGFESESFDDESDGDEAEQVSQIYSEETGIDLIDAFEEDEVLSENEDYELIASSEDMALIQAYLSGQI